MLGHLYYTIGIIPLIGMLAILARIGFYHKINQWSIKFKEVTGKDPLRKDYRSPEEYGFMIGIITLTIFEFIWILLGILTNSWYIFISIILLVVLINIIKRNIKITQISLFLSITILILKISLYLYLIINHFHLHYDTWNMISNHL